MGFRFRKSVKVGPMRVNLSKSGVGYSFGGKGYRVTKKANGGMRTTASIPGTGISYVKDYSGKTIEKTSASKAATKIVPETTQSGAHSFQATGSINSYCPVCYRRLEPDAKYCISCGHAIGSKVKRPIYTRWWFLLIVGIVCLRICGAIIGAKPTELEVSATEPTIQTEEVTIPTETPTSQATEATEPTTESTTEATTQTAGSISGYGFAQDDSGNKIDFVLNTSTKVFHYPTCRYAKQINDGNRKERTDKRSNIISSGYTPCGHCGP